MGIEQQAVDIVIKYEKRQGKKPIDVRKKKCGYDIKSGKRLIEVKGKSAAKPTWVQIYPTTFKKKIGEKNLKNYYIYLKRLLLLNII